MRIIVASDNHGRKDLLEKIIAKHHDADLFLHAGDSCMQEEEIAPFITVKGNQDFYISYRSRVVDANLFKIFVLHGHDTYLSDEVLAGIARNNDCKIIIHGHTHKPYYKALLDIHILCPGSLAYPRSLKGTTYAIIDCFDKDNINIRIEKI